ncbi:TIGR04086 family membrane protein [Anaerocolumna sp. MB42-C2]|uniref:TIGR04086 family membrane protein n=1 Tax=Anaerocolumna sp. MB42-C2 TaxID=3070997 RepID=UPI0027E16DBA|nr:TIGR04086 family membrane protein [Anaerocolumna sp. MB42-C2]WMJ89602.1 TIGR04086 family membrane protein [Anaerocolumna sp. MB42-C2]
MDKVLHRNSKVVVILRDLLVSYMVTGILLLLLAFLMLKTDLSGGILNGGILVTYVLSSFAGGFLLGKSAEQKRFLWGLGMGALYFIMLMLISVLTNSVMGMEASRVITVMVICLFSGMLGGMIS